MPIPSSTPAHSRPETSRESGWSPPHVSRQLTCALPRSQAPGGRRFHRRPRASLDFANLEPGGRWGRERTRRPTRRTWFPPTAGQASLSPASFAHREERPYPASRGLQGTLWTAAAAVRGDPLGSNSSTSSTRKGGVMESVLLDAAGHRRSPATVPGYHRGRPPRNTGEQYPADPPTRRRSRRSSRSCARSVIVSRAIDSAR